MAPDACACTHCKAKQPSRPRVLWAIKQLLPRTYWTVYGDSNGKNHFCIWKMWLGRCYDVTDFDYER